LDFLFDFLLPVSVLKFAPLVILVFELPYFFHLMLFFDLLAGLLNRLIKKNVEDWLHFDIVVKEVIILNLGNLIDTSLLWDVFGSWWFRLENVSLNLNF